MRSTRTVILSSLVFLCAAVSCKRMEEVNPPIETEWISFSTGDGIVASGEVETKAMENEITCDISDWEYEEDLAGTKAGIVEAIYDSVGVFGYNYNEWSSSVLPEVMCNMKNTLNGSNLTPETKVLWKRFSEKDSLRFYAYAPYGKFTVSGKDIPGVPYLTVNVSSDNSRQIDILYAQSANVHKDNRSAVPLKFKHAMTAVKFRMGDTGDTLTSLSITNVKYKGKLSLDGTWSNLSGARGYTIASTGTVLVLIPQTLTDASIVTLKYKNSDGPHTIKANLAGQEWPAGKKVVYTLKKKPAPGTVEYVYFDFTAGDIILTESSYSGYAYVTDNKDSIAVKVPVKGTPTPSTKYYIYQSAPDSIVTAKKISNESIMSSKTGYSSAADIGKKTPTLPKYTTINVGGKTWGEYITNNTDPAAVLAKWNEFPENFLEPGTPHRILICGDAKFDITLDRVYSRYFPYRGNYYVKKSKKEYFAGVEATNPSSPSKPGGESYKELYGGITVGIDTLDQQNVEWAKIAGKETVYKQFKEKVILRLKGDNYFSRIAYNKPPQGTKGESVKWNGYLTITSEKGNSVAEGTLTVTLPYLRDKHPNYDGLYNFTRGGLIGAGNVSGKYFETDLCYRQVCDISFKGGVVYVGIEEINNSVWPNNENMMCTIGGINAISRIAITGGILTSISYGSSPAIGGGAGWLRNGGNGYVDISGGTVYAHSFGVYNPEDEVAAPVMSTAIGGGSSGNYTGNSGSVTITGGTVYAYSLGGCAIGGGTSAKMKGGSGSVTIRGGQVYAKSIAGIMGTLPIDAGVAIGGGRSGTEEKPENVGGDATVKIYGGTIVAGSVGGGKSGNKAAKIGKATIIVDGGETSAQFLLVTDPSEATSNKFTMTKGTISNSSTLDSEYTKAMPHGGAVYMESGTCTIKGGYIYNCTGSLGGAVYVNGGTFNMSGGTINYCSALTDGGAVYIEGGDVNLSGTGTIDHNIASSGNGGGVCIRGGNFTMTGGSVIENAADSDSEFKEGGGGGIYVASDSSSVKVEITGGKVQHNASDRNGGGLCVNMSGAVSSAVTANIIIGNVGGVASTPLISENEAAFSGGGMAVQGEGSRITINSGTIKGNVSAYVKNEDIRNDGGIVDLVGKGSEVDVNYKTIYFYANNGSDPEPSDEQRVITSTNSVLRPTATALAFEKRFYHLASWNTKRDGTGKEYPVDGGGSTMNITEDVALYGQWVRNQ